MASFLNIAGQPEELSITVASGDELQVRQFTVQARMSSLFVVTLVATCKNADVDFDAVVGQPARFSIRSGPYERSWSGLCNRLQQIGIEEGGASTYHVNIVPMLWLATQRRNHRMFQQQSELDIALVILDEWGIQPEKKLTARYKRRKYRVQYGESDFSFISRMLEDAGISFYFEQHGEETKLVLADAPQLNEPRAEKIPFREGSGANGDHLSSVRVGQQVRPGRYTVRDHDYRRPPAQKLLASVDATGSALERRLEQYHYEPGAFLFGADKGEDTPHADDRGKTRTDEVEGKLLAQKRLEAKRGSARVCTFETNALDLGPGVVMSMLGHPRAELGEAQKLLIVESTVSGMAGSLSQTCEARSAASPYRPPMETPKPKVSGVESATVVGPKGEEIHTDEFGRVRVHFHWDRESEMDEKSSCWIHVSQPWGGSGFGGSNLPRIGQEVLVDFLGGDPDKPVIVGRMYTNLQKTPYKLPDNKTQSGWKSNSTGGSGGYNELMFEDAGGNEMLRMQAQKDMSKLVKNDESARIGKNRAKSIGNDDSISIGNNRSSMVGSNNSEVVGGNESVAVGGNQKLTVGGNQDVTITGNQTEGVTGNRKVTITKTDTESVTGTQSVTVTGAQTTTLKSSHAIDVTSSQTIKVGAEQTITVTGAQTISSAALQTIKAPAQEIKAEGNQKLKSTILSVDASAIATIQTALLNLIGTGMTSMNTGALVIASGPISISGGAISISGGKVTISGSPVEIDGGPQVSVTAGVIKLN